MNQRGNERRGLGAFGHPPHPNKHLDECAIRETLSPSGSGVEYLVSVPAAR
jgi:hypothetical protein